MAHFDLSLWAYLDPFTGALILQVIAAFLIGAGVMLRKYLLAPFTWLFRRHRADEQDTQIDSQGQP